eukprot:Awhi_evm1s15794
MFDASTTVPTTGANTVITKVDYGTDGNKEKENGFAQAVGLPLQPFQQHKQQNVCQQRQQVLHHQQLQYVPQKLVLQQEQPQLQQPPRPPPTPSLQQPQQPQQQQYIQTASQQPQPPTLPPPLLPQQQQQLLPQSSILQQEHQQLQPPPQQQQLSQPVSQQQQPITRPLQQKQQKQQQPNINLSLLVENVMAIDSIVSPSKNTERKMTKRGKKKNVSYATLNKNDNRRSKKENRIKKKNTSIKLKNNFNSSSVKGKSITNDILLATKAFSNLSMTTTATASTSSSLSLSTLSSGLFSSLSPPPTTITTAAPSLTSCLSGASPCFTSDAIQSTAASILTPVLPALPLIGEDGPNPLFLKVNNPSNNVVSQRKKRNRRGKKEKSPTSQPVLGQIPMDVSISAEYLTNESNRKKTITSKNTKKKAITRYVNVDDATHRYPCTSSKCRKAFRSLASRRRHVLSQHKLEEEALALLKFESLSIDSTFKSQASSAASSSVTTASSLSVTAASVTLAATRTAVSSSSSSSPLSSSLSSSSASSGFGSRRPHLLVNSLEGYCSRDRKKIGSVRFLKGEEPYLLQILKQIFKNEIELENTKNISNDKDNNNNNNDDDDFDNIDDNDGGFGKCKEKKDVTMAKMFLFYSQRANRKHLLNQAGKLVKADGRKIADFSKKLIKVMLLYRNNYERKAAGKSGRYQRSMGVRKIEKKQFRIGYEKVLTDLSAL